MTKATLCLWYNNDAEDAANFYAATFPDSTVGQIHLAPSDSPGGTAGGVMIVEFTVFGMKCIGLNGGPMFPHTEAFSFQIATDTQEKPTATGMRLSEMAALKANVAGARTNGASIGSSHRAF